ncbi:MAG: CHASE2 domain-containing protein [Thermoanaerobaculia bacterium]
MGGLETLDALRYRFRMSAFALRIVLAMVAGVLVTGASALHWLAPLELLARDAFLRLVPEQSARSVAVVAIDERSLAREGSWPWHRGRLAQLVDRSAAAGAAAVGIDILLSDPRPGDALLSEACRRVRCVAATSLNESGRWVLPTPRGVLPAHAAFEIDDDGVLRWIASTKQDESSSYPALSTQLASLVTRNPLTAGVAIVPGLRAPPSAVPVVSAADILDGKAVSVPELRDRIVLIGITAIGLGDRVITPRTPRHQTDAGVLVHAATVESLLRGDVFHELSPITGGVVAAGLVWFTLRAARIARDRRRLAVEAVLLLLPTAIGVALLFAQTFAPVVALSGLVATVVLSTEARGAIRLARHGRVAVATLESSVGLAQQSAGDVGETLEVLAADIVRRRVEDQESRRVLVHELKTPLSAMDSLSQVLTEFELTPSERHRVALLIGDETRKLQEMIARLLEVERITLRGQIDSGAIIDLAAFTASRGEFLATGLGRRVNVSCDRTVFIRGDSALLERVLDNLVGNAAKYSVAGEAVDIAVRNERGAVILEVMDRGPGIPPEERTRIFGSFERGTAAAGTEGFGLGLSLVTEAVRWHGGDVDVADRPGGGSIFRVRLPVATGIEKEAV